MVRLESKISAVATDTSPDTKMKKNGTVIILVGPKGCGKTYIGSLLERQIRKIHFVRVESIFMKLKAEKSSENDEALDMKKLTEWCYEETAQEVQNALLMKEGVVDEKATNNVDKEIGITTDDDKVAVLEVTGVAPQLPKLLKTLQSRHTVKFVKVSASLETCLQRTKERDTSQHIPVSEDRINEINRLASAVEYPWDMMIQNDPFKTDEEILGMFMNLL